MTALLMRPDGTVFAEKKNCIGEVFACTWARALIETAREPGTYRLIVNVPDRVRPVYAATFRKGQP